MKCEKEKKIEEGRRELGRKGWYVRCLAKPEEDPTRRGGRGRHIRWKKEVENKNASDVGGAPKIRPTRAQGKEKEGNKKNFFNKKI